MHCSVKMGNSIYGASYVYIIGSMPYLYNISQKRGVSIVISIGKASISIVDGEFILTIVDKNTAGIDRLMNDYFNLVERQWQSITRNGVEFVPHNSEKVRLMKQYYKDIQNEQITKVLLLNENYIQNGVLSRYYGNVATVSHTEPSVIDVSNTGVITLCSSSRAFFEKYASEF